MDVYSQINAHTLTQRAMAENHSRHCSAPTACAITYLHVPFLACMCPSLRACAPRAISNAFQYLQRRKRAAFRTAISRTSLPAMEAAYGKANVDYIIDHTKPIFSSGRGKSTSTDAGLLAVSAC